ncbi:hypothetical protein C0J52_13488 [Blattella germanica]|nr:hypothetical protein C0J52_13488 [Blattella germanica]
MMDLNARRGTSRMLQFEKGANVKFCQKLGKSATETLQNVYGDDALGRSAVFKWHQRFSQGRDSFENDQRIGRPAIVPTERNIEEVVTVTVRAPREVDDIAAALGVSHDTCHKILTDDLNMSRITQHRVPRILTQY